MKSTLRVTLRAMLRDGTNMETLRPQTIFEWRILVLVMHTRAA
jgi:hypothetical protein